MNSSLSCIGREGKRNFEADVYALKPIEIVTALKAAGEQTRLRLLVLLARSEHNVKDLTRILGQSQPRVSRHLKLLFEARLIERFQEGSWVYFRLREEGPLGELVQAIVRDVAADDADMNRDDARALEVKNERERAAQEYFRNHAKDWDAIRALHIAEDDVERAIVDTLGEGKISQLVDVGTGTGRILQLLAGYCSRAIGFDINQDMLAYARAKLERQNHKHCQVRLGDVYNLPIEDHTADLVVLHQVLHFLDDPAGAIREAARLCAPDGQILIVDFAPHELEHLRDDHAHRRLGFSSEQMQRWFAKAGLSLKTFRDLKPRKKSEMECLTVSLWLGTSDNKKTGKQMKNNDRDMEVVADGI